VGGLAKLVIFTVSVAGGLGGCRGILGIEPAPGEPPAEASMEASTDAAIEEAADVDARPADAGPPFCTSLSPQAEFCADFDEPHTDFESGWDNDTDAGIPDPGVSGCGMLQVDTKKFRSWPASVLVSTPDVVSSSGEVNATLLKTIPLMTKLTVQFDIFVDTLILSKGAGTIIIAAVDYGDTGAVTLFLDAGGLELSVDPVPGTEETLLANVPTGTWTTVKLEVSTSGGGSDGTAYAASSGFNASASVPATYFQSSSQPVRVILGASAGGPVGMFAANIDNVAMYWSE
jgi:hypothetical protein